MRTDYKLKNVIVRIHGVTDKSKLEDACSIFLKKVITAKEKNQNGNRDSSKTVRA